VGHEGSGSLLSALKVKRWATRLSSGVADGGHERSSAAWLFQTTITLTEAGLENKMEVASLFFQYLHMLRQAGPQEWVFNEVAAVKDIEFRFQVRP
jgi:nardilysin